MPSYGNSRMKKSVCDFDVPSCRHVLIVLIAVKQPDTTAGLLIHVREAKSIDAVLIFSVIGSGACCYKNKHFAVLGAYEYIEQQEPTAT